ncbi:MAG: response regulator [Desulfamplus sp.]|nr:response regulator [Desulfamplus sp.]
MFYQIQKKIASKLALVIVFVVTIVSIISTFYFNNLNKKNLTEYLNISLSNAIYFSEMGYGQPLWDYNEEELARLSNVILKNKLIIAINVFDMENFLTGSIKKIPKSSDDIFYNLIPEMDSSKEDVTPSDKAEGTSLEEEETQQGESSDDFIISQTQILFQDNSIEYPIVKLKVPYQIPLENSYIKKVSGNVILKDKAVGKFELFYTEQFMHNAIVQSNNRMILAFVIIAVLIIIVMMFGASKINKPILELARISEKIAQDSDYSVKIKKSDRIDEVGILVNGFVKMIDQIRQKELERNTLYETLEKSLERFNYLFSNLQVAIDHADYSLRIKPESENDELAFSLNKVMQTLEDADIVKRNQSWIKNGQAELSSIIGREQDIIKLASKAIDFIASYVNALIGTLFVKDDFKNDFRMAASYAFKTRKGLSNRFKAGEGLIGQTALEKKSIIFTQIPEDYIRIESSLGNISPKNIIVLPVIYEDDVKGVIELGSVLEFSPLQMEFLEIASEILAVSINGAIFNEKLSLLLEQTKEQAEELKSQQEELKATNEELEEQARILRASEEKLQAQQEELRASNEELEEKTKILQTQKREIEKSNEILQSKQMEIEEKACQLRIETQYKSEFLANMSHELRTPLNSLLILANMLAENEEENLTPDQIESAASIYRSGQNLLHLINDILDLSKIEAKKIELNISKFSLKETGAHFKTEFLHMAKAKGIEFRVTMDDNLPEMITTDMHRLEQIIRNLIGNAIKFTETGSITLCFENAILSGEPYLSSILQKNAKNMVAISVIDTGSGIPSDKLDAIFEAFKQVDGSIRRKHEGTGLGLSISKELAHLLGGEIKVQSELGKGSTFTLYLPENFSADSKSLSVSESPKNAPDISNIPAKSNLDKPSSTDYRSSSKEEKKEPPPLTDRTEPLPDRTDRMADRTDPLPHSSSSSIESKTMLIIEDDAEFAKILSNFFKKHGYRTVIAPSGEDGIKYVIDQKPTAIILDISLPGIDGWAVMNELKTNPDTRHIPVHIMSGYDQSRKGLEKGAIGYLTKPVSSEGLNKALQKIETVLSNDVKHLLVVEDNSELQLSILKLMGTNDIKVTSAVTGEEAIALLKDRDFDCMILDLGLPDISGFELMDRIRSDPKIEMLPVIIFTGRDLTSEETQKLEQYATSIVLKNAVSMERLIDETALFLHRVESEMPENQKKMIKKVREQQTFLKDKKVLVVDDDMRNAFALNKFLKSKGMEVIIANNGEKALKVLDDGERPDIILMDIMMPVMDGYEAMKQIRNRKDFQATPIIALTAKAMSSDRDECIKCGANDYLSKPLDTAKLLTLLRVWLYDK